MKKTEKHLLLVIVLQMIFTSFLWSQNSKPYTHNSLAEKIYLQLDNEVYTTNKTIWFKAIILNAASHNGEYSSGILYVDIIDSESQIIESKLVKIKDGIGNGYFDLDRGFDEGAYLIRAYSEWNKNFESDFVFEKYVQIHSESSEDTFKDVIQNIRVIDSSLNSYTIVADVFPSSIDKQYNEALTMIISENGRLDTIVLNPDKEGVFALEYQISKTTTRVALEIETNSKSKYKTSFSPNNDYLDLQFFPEGGKLLQGMSSKIGFKAIGADGKAVEVEGEIMDNLNQVVTSFKSNVLGMGSFVIENPKISNRYVAKLSDNSNALETKIVLPKVHSFGFALSVMEKEDRIYVKVSHTDKKTDTVTLKGVCRGYTYINSEATLIDGQYIYAIPKKALPDGIIVFKLFENSMQPVANRLYFNERKNARVLVNANLEKLKYEQREKIELDIKTTGFDSVPVIAHTSILGIELLDSNSQLNATDNILSYFLMSSDLKGIIEKPSYYFESKRSEEIDYLMLTQGWTNYKYTKPLRNLNFKLEKNLSVSGVINKKRRTKEDQLDLMLMTLDESRNTYTKSIKVPSSFNFDLEDMYGVEQEIIIQGAENWDKEHKNYAIGVQRKKPLLVNFIYDDTHMIKDSLVTRIVNKNKAQKSEEDVAYFNTYGRTELDEVFLSGYNMTPKRKEVFERYGEPEIVIDGEELMKKERKFHSSGLYSILLDFFKDKITIDQGETGLLSARVLGLPTLVIVDGLPVRPIFFPQLQDMVTSQITSFEVLETAKNFSNLYSTVYPGTMQVPSFGGIISIYTKNGIGLAGALDFPDKSLNFQRIPVFALEKEFYSPQHNSNSYYDPNTPDLRGPIYWNPNVITNVKGEATINFYHSDDIGDFQLIVETVTSNGKIGYKLINYSVEKRKE